VLRAEGDDIYCPNGFSFLKTRNQGANQEKKGKRGDWKVRKKQSRVLRRSGEEENSPLKPQRGGGGSENRGTLGACQSSREEKD